MWNVAGPLVDRFEDDFIDQLDNAGFLGHLQQSWSVSPAVISTSSSPTISSRVVAAQAIVGLDELLDVILGRQHRLDVQPGEQADVIEGVKIEASLGDVQGAVWREMGSRRLR